MSMQIGKRELVALAREIHEGPGDFEEALRRCNDCFVKKLENRLWGDLVEKYPDRDFAGPRESVARKGLFGRLKTLMNCKLKSLITWV